MAEGVLLLESGEVFKGTLLGASNVVGEVVFNTSMTGYQEMVTDPSYSGQILVFCYPLIGNYGMSARCSESTRPQVAGIAAGEICGLPSHHLAEASFLSELTNAGIPCLVGVDTRALVKRIRSQGTVRGIITTEQRLQEMNSSSVFTVSEPNTVVARVTTPRVVTYENRGAHTAVIDYGCKRSIIDSLVSLGCRVTVVPYTFTYDQMRALNPDGVLLSNGPGDPLWLQDRLLDIRRIAEDFPTLGVCLGHQLLGLAFGGSSRKLMFGHRGGNHPVRDTATGRVFMSAQNHGYVIESEGSGPMSISHVNVNDGTIEGLRHQTLPVEGVQFHPEAHPGPDDSVYILQSFVQRLQRGGGVEHAAT